MQAESRALAPLGSAEAQIAPVQMGLVRPLVDPSTARDAITEYENLKAAIVRDDDITIINGKPFLRKPFWRRVATCFGLSLELVQEERVVDNGRLSYSVMYRAIAPNGRSMTGDGYCDSGEKRGVPEHNIRAIAHTRAKNRAISDLVGGGEVSADEMAEYDEPTSPGEPTHVTTSRGGQVKQVKLNAGQVRAEAEKRGISGPDWANLWREHKGDLKEIWNALQDKAIVESLPTASGE